MIQPGLRSAVDAKSEERAFRSDANGSSSEGVQFVQKVQIVQPPPSSSPATRGRKEVRELNPSAVLRTGSAKRLNGLNGLNVVVTKSGSCLAQTGP